MSAEAKDPVVSPVTAAGPAQSGAASDTHAVAEVARQVKEAAKKASVEVSDKAMPPRQCAPSEARELTGLQLLLSCHSQGPTRAPHRA